MRRRLVACAVVSALCAASFARADDTVRPEQRTVARPRPPPTNSAFANALRLAHMLNDDHTIAMLVAARGQTRDAKLEEVAQAVDAYENLGDPDRGVELLKQRIALFPKETAARVMLAELYERDARSADAAATWRTLDAPTSGLALTAAQVVAYARDLARTGKTEEAFAVLKAHVKGTSDDAIDFWHDLGILAWELEDDDTSLIACRKVWAKDPATPNIGPRLMTLAKEHGLLDEAVTVALAEYARNKEPTTLLFAASTQAERRDWAGAKKTLTLAEADPAGFAKREEYWMLRAEVASELGDEAGAMAAYRSALAVRPSNTTAQAAILWRDIDHDDAIALDRDLERFRTQARVSPNLWAPFGVGLDRLGRSREALEFILRDWHTHPDDDASTLELANALTSTGAVTIADRLRRRVQSRRETAALAVLHANAPKKEEVALLVDHVEYVRERAGVAMGERWLNATLGVYGDQPDARDLALSTYVTDERWVRARRASRWAVRSPIAMDTRMSLAVNDGDYGEVRRLLSMPELTSEKKRAEGFELLERDADELKSLNQAWSAEPDADRTATARRIRELIARHQPNVKVGGGYVYVNGLSDFTVDVGAAHDLGSFRVLYTGSGGSISLTHGSPAVDTLVLAAPRAEASLGVLLRHTDTRGVTEVGAGADYQPERPLPRLTFFDEHVFGKVWATKIDASLDDMIEDTPFLRLEGARSRATLGLRADYARRLYTAVEVTGLEDHSRRFNHLALGVAEVIETGVKLVRGEPEWDLGIEAEAVQRSNVSLDKVASVTQSDLKLRDPECPACYLPESYQVVSVVTHLTRGDFASRYRPDRRAFPRYDCDAGLGLIFPSQEAAAHVGCSVSVRIAGSGFASATAVYDRGVAGSDEQVARTSLSFTQPF